MNQSVHSVATALALGFAGSFVIRAVWWTSSPIHPALMVASILLYVAAVLMVVLGGSEGGSVAGRGAGALAVVAAVVVPVGTSLALASADRTEPFATWYIGGVGVLAIALVVRGRRVWGWTVLGLLVIMSSAFLGPIDALRLGLVGSFTWVVLAQVLEILRRRVVDDTQRLAEIQQAVSAWETSQDVRRRERRMRARLALSIAGPILTRTVATGGVLDDDERVQARLAERALRDELRGAALLDDGVRDAIAGARRRGVVVTVLDEGGLNDVDDDERQHIRRELAAVIRQAHSERLIVRSGGDASVAATVVGRAASGSEEDSVELFHEIARHSGAVQESARE